MFQTFLRTAGVVLLPLALLSSAACDADSPTRPSALDGLAGAWTLGATGSGELPDACTQLEYEITPAPDGRTAAVRFNGTCAGITASGTGSGTLSGDTLRWSAEGTASGRGMTCPFTFRDSTATREGSGLRIAYAGTVCGLPVQGNDLLLRR